jgi:hypothetical protein
MQVLEARGTKCNTSGVEVAQNAVQAAITDGTRAGSAPQQDFSQAPVTTGAGSHFGWRAIGGVSTEVRRVGNRHASISRFRINQPANISITNGTTELDSHANTTCVGKNFCIISYTARVCEVSPYHPSYQSISNVPIVQAVTAFGNPNSGETFVSYAMKAFVWRMPWTIL